MISLVSTPQVSKAQAKALSYLSISLIFCLSCLACLVLAGCSSGSSSSGESGSYSISGVASKGIINNGLVRAYAVNNDGIKGAELGSGLTDINGQYSLDIANHNGPVIIEVTGGSYTDEATGSTVDNNTLRAVIPPVSSNRKVAITPLTEIAVQIAGSTLTLTQINNANAAVSVLIGGADVTETQPQDINGDLSSASQSEKDYTMVLAAVSQMIEDGNATDVASVTTMISDDLGDDGSLTVKIDNDFDENGEPVTVGSGAGYLLQEAVTNFIASDENNTGLSEDEVSLDESLVSASVIYVLVKTETEYDGDNVIDEIAIFGYDAEGNKIMTASDGDWADDIVPDDVIDLRTSSTYDANRNPLSVVTDYLGDGTINRIVSYSYTTDGRPVVEEIDSNNDGIVDIRRTWTYSNIAGGTRIIKDFDTNVDDIPDLRHIYEYNAAGKKVLEERDTNVDGVNLRFTYSYDENSYLVMQEQDGDGANAPDGIIDIRLLWTNDADGRRVVQDGDTNADGTIDNKQTWTYNELGKVSRYEFDNNYDGTPDEYIDYSYDADGNLILEEGLNSAYVKRIYTWQRTAAAPVLFSGNNGADDAELWATDGTELGTYMVKNIDESGFGSFPESYTVVGKNIFFWAYDSTYGYELWVSDGAGAGTRLVKDLWPGSGSSNPHNLVAFKGRLYFSAIDYNNSRYLMHVSDGSAAGTQLLLDRDSNLIGSPSWIKIVGDKLVFSASNGINGYELWVSDGTEAGTHMLKDINPGAANSDSSWMHVIDGKLYFAANDGVHASELWVSDGTEAGTQLVKDIRAGALSSGPNQMADISGGNFVFRADGDDAGVAHDEIWLSDGTEAGTILLLDPATDIVHSSMLTSINNNAIFVSNDATYGTELWITDGTVTGTTLLKDINPGADSSNPSYYDYVSHAGKVYFVANDGTNGAELWLSDGTQVGTKMVKDINSGAGSVILWDLRVHNNKLYFATNDGTHGNELWVTDGTEVGTYMIKDANVGVADGYIGVDPDY